MRRRLLLPVLACCLAAPALAQEGEARPRHKISAGELHKALVARFPVRLGVAGLLQLEVDAPGLLLLPARNKLGATLQVQASGPGRQRLPAGELDLLFSLRYEAQDQSVRAHQPEVLQLRLPGLPPETLGALQALLPALAKEAVGEFVLHRLTPRELALADTMGLEPEQLTVVEDGLLVEFRAKRR